jgi:hypothetical protein
MNRFESCMKIPKGVCSIGGMELPGTFVQTTEQE